MPAQPPIPSLGERTVRDFGQQWTAFTENEGYYGSIELFNDLITPLLTSDDFRGRSVADIGSGTGRIVRMLAQAGARRIVAVEPSAAIGPLRANTSDLGDRLQILHATGDELPAGLDLDYVVSFGVLHHIPDPAPVVAAAHAALRPGGRLFVWLYGQEGNEHYLRFVLPLRRLTGRLGHRGVSALSRVLRPPLAAYAWLCHYMPLPMQHYMVDHVAKLSPDVQRLTIYDQLNPAYARYYTHDEAIALLRDAGFVDVRAYHRHGYSWSVVGTKS
jgi:SAM-dependent methyltransferase